MWNGIPVTQADDALGKVTPLSRGTQLASGSFQLHELSGFIHWSSNINELPFTKLKLLPRPVDEPERGVVPILPGQVRAWSEFYKSSFYVADSAGRGAYGEVWRGFMIKDGLSSRVVLKRIYTSKGSDGVAAAMREVYFGSMLSSTTSHVARFMNHFVEDRDLWLVFRDEGISLYQAIFQPVFVHGLSIMYRSKFWEQIRLTKELPIRVIYQVLKGLSELHSQNITHRDLKLENILVDPNSMEVRIGDLGSAARASDDISLTASLYAPRGPTPAEETARYAPPERMGMDLSAVIEPHPSFDIWCVGIVWLEMLLGTVDLELDNPRDGICVRYSDCPSLRDRIRAKDPYQEGIVDDQVFDLLSRLLHIKPELRPSASEALQHAVFKDVKHAPQSEFSHFLRNEEGQTERISSFKILTESALHQGSRTDMEDRLMMRSIEGRHLSCVFDGHNGAKVASLLAERFPDLVFASRDSLKEAIDQVVAEIEASVGDLDLGLYEGSTLCCVLVDERSGYVTAANIGDSRLIVVEPVESPGAWVPVIGARVIFGEDYSSNGKIVDIQKGHVIVYPDGKDGRRTVARRFKPETDPPLAVKQITIDHKPDVPEELIYINSMGGFVSNSNPPRLNDMLAVSRSIGARGLKPYLRSEADIFKFTASQPMRLVLATDGIWDILNNQEVAELSEQGPKSIIDAALENGGRDNMAVIVVDISFSDPKIISKDEL